MTLNIIYEQKKKEEIRKKEIKDVFSKEKEDFSEGEEKRNKNIDISRNYFGDDLLEYEQKEKSNIKILPFEMVAIFFVIMITTMIIISQFL